MDTVLADAVVLINRWNNLCCTHATHELIDDTEEFLKEHDIKKPEVKKCNHLNTMTLLIPHYFCIINKNIPKLTSTQITICLTCKQIIKIE